MTDVGQWLDASDLGRYTTAFIETALGRHSLEVRAHAAFITPMTDCSQGESSP